MLRFRLRTLMIVALALSVCANVAIYRAIPYAKPMAEAAGDYFVEHVARVLYRNGGNCNLMLD
jgi:hypothetical protein